MTASEPKPEKKPFTRESVVLIPMCPRCKKQDVHRQDCNHADAVTGAWRRVDTFIGYDRSPEPPVTRVIFTHSPTPTNYQASPDGSTIQYSESFKSNGEGWRFLNRTVEGTGR